MNNDVIAILESTSYCTVATTSSDQTPWNVPVRFAFDNTYLYFRSPGGTTHGSNIALNPTVSIVIFDTSQTVKGAVYVHSRAEKLFDEEEQIAQKAFNLRFDNPSDQWPDTEYYRVTIGALNKDRTKEKMFYFDSRGQE